MRSEKGFTLIEIIAVLVILGILAGVAIHKYINLANEARIKAAQNAIAEVKGRLSTAQAKYMINHNGTAPTSPQLYTYATRSNAYGNATNLANVGNDYNVRVRSGTPIRITVRSVQNQALNPNVVGNFKAAGDP